MLTPTSLASVWPFLVGLSTLLMCTLPFDSRPGSPLDGVWLALMTLQSEW